MKILIIDNYDSYTYNLYQLIAQITPTPPLVIKNDQLSYEELQDLDFDSIVISPGPGHPEREADFGLCRQVIQESDKPILGVCLGQQGIYILNGGKVDLAPQPMHGRLSTIQHNDQGLFKGLPQDFKVTRYHSLVCIEEDLDNIRVDARTEDGLIMGISHLTKPQYAVQFHPEAIATEYGQAIIENFIDLAQTYLAEQTPLYFEKFPLQSSALAIFDQVYQSNPQAQWLDSSLVSPGLSRFSIIGQMGPKYGHRLTYSLQDQSLIRQNADGSEQKFEVDLFTYLNENQIHWPAHPDLPCDFQLGYIGYLGYELKSLTEGSNQHQSSYPDAQLDYIDRAIIIDHQENTVYALSYKDDHEWIAQIDWQAEANVLELAETNDLPLAWAMSRSEYIEAIETCQELIKQGESYEICLTNCLRLNKTLAAYPYYRCLREASPSPYSAFLNFKGLQVACSSMEKFLTLDRKGMITTKPIKGTAKRGENLSEDQSIIYQLAHEEKTMAENLMIVDLLRNDLGKICQIGSVKVPHLMAVESYSTLHQLVTTVQGLLDPQYSMIDLIKATFPGGSMTGAPKHRTLDLIDQLEKQARGIYSGAIGYLSNNGCLDLNIVIRTAVIDNEQVTFGMGGAIIALSDPAAEFEEIAVKAQGALNALKRYHQISHEVKLPISGELD